MATRSPHRSAVLVSLAPALGGLLFGYDTAVISGVIEPVRNKFHLSTAYEGWFVGCGLLGCIIGVLVAGILSNSIGRKKVLVLAGITFLISAIGCSVAFTKELLVAARLLGGIGVGIASVISPMYITEFAPAKKRGSLVAMYQLAITVGIFLAYLVNAGIAAAAHTFNDSTGIAGLLFGREVWRGMFVVMAIPSIVFIFIVSFIPESIRYLVSKGRLELGKEILFNTRNRQEAEQEWLAMTVAQQHSGNAVKRAPWRSIKFPLFIGIFLAVFQQFSGINAIIYYGPEIFSKAGIPAGNALYFQAIIGAVNILFTFVAIRYADKAGRRSLLLYGLAGLIISLVLIGFICRIDGVPGYMLLICMLAYIGCFALSLGPVTWILVNEIFPAAYRVQGVTICTLAGWVAVWMLGQFFPLMLDKLGIGNTFWLFALCCLVHFFVSYRFVVETKGKQLEEIERIFVAH
jgi:SP family arabinose:H+ symporter-like MFS transporter